MQSYTSQRSGIMALLSEALNLYRSRAGDVPGRVRDILLRLHKLEKRLQEDYRFTLKQRDILDVGAGQFLVQMRYFARQNRVTGIDYDVIAQGFDLLNYWRMLVLNGPRRAVKTVIRKLSRIDRKYQAELKAQLALRSLPRLDVRRMDACNMSFSDESFDFVHSYSVFHHLQDPAAALNGIARILRPGGMAYISLHLYTSETGCLDPRVFTEHRGEVPLWSHLRPRCSIQVMPNAYVNKLRLGQWKELFTSKMPGAIIITNRTERAGVEDDAKTLLASGELQGYSLEELITHELVILWRKQ